MPSVYVVITMVVKCDPLLVNYVFHLSILCLFCSIFHFSLPSLWLIVTAILLIGHQNLNQFIALFSYYCCKTLVISNIKRLTHVLLCKKGERTTGLMNCYIIVMEKKTSWYNHDSLCVNIISLHSKERKNHIWRNYNPYKHSVPC